MAKAFDFPADAEPIARHASENVADLQFQVSRSRPETLLSQFPEPGASGWVPEGWYADTAAGIAGTARPAVPDVSTHGPLWVIMSSLFWVKLD